MSIAAALRVLQDDYAEHGEHCDCQPCQALEELERKTRFMSCRCGNDLELKDAFMPSPECGTCWTDATMATRAR